MSDLMSEIVTAKEIGRLQEGQRQLEREDEQQRQDIKAIESKIGDLQSMVLASLREAEARTKDLIKAAVADSAKDAASQVVTLLRSKDETTPVRLTELIREKPLTAMGVAAAGPPLLYQIFVFLTQLVQHSQSVSP